MRRIVAIIAVASSLAGCAIGGSTTDLETTDRDTAADGETRTLVRRMESTLAETLIDNGIDKLVSKVLEMA